MGEYKNIHAVIDNYHEGAFPVIAICPTHEAAEGKPEPEKKKWRRQYDRREFY